MSRLGQTSIQSIGMRDVAFGYGEGALVLDGVTTDIPMGKVLHITGPTGHGQSTFLKVLACLVEPTTGGVIVNGTNVTEMSFEEFVPIRLEIGYTFEVGGLLSNKSLYENLALPHLYHNLLNAEDLEKRIHSVAKRFRFDAFLERRPAMVSSGLRKLVSTLRPMLVNPSVLVMDDPFAGLDPETARELKVLIEEMRGSGDLKTICLTSRDETWPGRLNAEPLWIESGKVTYRGKAA